MSVSPVVNGPSPSAPPRPVEQVRKAPPPPPPEKDEDEEAVAAKSSDDNDQSVRGRLVDISA